MKYLFLISTLFLSLALLSQEVVSPLKYNPYQNKSYQINAQNDKSSLVRQNLIYQFDTLKLPFKEDFSSNYFPTQDADTSNAVRITISLLLRNGNPIGSSEVFSTDTSFRYIVYPANNDSISAALPNPSEQITYVDFSVFPFEMIDTTVWPAYTLYDTLGRGIDTVFFPTPDLVQKKMTKYLLPPDSNIFWMDHYVYRNNDFPVDPPSIGVVTFDGLDENGLPYDFDANVNGNADKMTSVPIDISGLDASDSVYLSFYYQPQGLSPDYPNHGDSLILDFYNAGAQKWEQAWGINGGIRLQPFEKVFVLVDTPFFSNAFQFRFRNRANLSGDFDQWHVDYILLDKNRSVKDTVEKDVTFVKDPPSFIKDYTSMPWFHYNINPTDFTKDTLETCFTNRFHQSLSVFYALQMINTKDTFQYFRNPSSTGTFTIVNGSTSRCQDFSVEGPPTLFSTLLRTEDFKDEETIEAKYSVDFRPASSEVPDLFPSNDTLRKLQVFSNYYSYDDGTAEAGYGIENYPENIMLTYYQMPVSDSLVGLKIYFLPQAYDVSKHKFKIVVYNSLSSNGLIYESSQELQPSYTDKNEFALYVLDSLLPVGKDFYVGVKALGIKSLNIGYDLNTPNKSKIYRRYTENDAFLNPSAAVPEGSLMIRPVFRELKVNVGMEEIENPLQNVLLYPNPSNGKIFIKDLPKDSKIKVFDKLGKMVYSGREEESLNLEGLRSGIYYVQLISNNGQNTITKKIILSPY